MTTFPIVTSKGLDGPDSQFPLNITFAIVKMLSHGKDWSLKGAVNE